MMKFEVFLAETLKNPACRKEYDALEPEYALKQLLIDLRTNLKAIGNALIRRFRRKQ